MNNELQLLISLQEKDTVLDKLRVRAEGIPQQIDEMKASLSGHLSRLDEAKNELKQCQVDRNGKEIELGIKEEEIKKHNINLNAIKTNDAYKKMLSEIEQCKNAKQKLEDDILVIMDEAEKKAVEIKGLDKELKEEELNMKSKIAAFEGELKKVQDEAALHQSERDEFAKQVPADLMSRYENIRDGRQGQAVVPVDGDNCGGCSITLRPQIINDVFKAQDMITCDNCSRILYKKIEKESSPDPQPVVDNK